MFLIHPLKVYSSDNVDVVYLFDFGSRGSLRSVVKETRPQWNEWSKQKASAQSWTTYPSEPKESTVVMRMREGGLLERKEENPLGCSFRDIRTREETASRKLNLRGQVSGGGTASEFANLGDREREGQDNLLGQSAGPRQPRHHCVPQCCCFHTSERIEHVYF